MGQASQGSRRRSRRAVWSVLPLLAIWAGSIQAAPPEVTGVLMHKENGGERLTFQFLPGDPGHPIDHYTVYRGHLGAPFDAEFKTLGRLRTVLDPHDGSLEGDCAVNDGEVGAPAESFYFLITATDDVGEGTLGAGSGGLSRGGTFGDPPTSAPEVFPQSWTCQFYLGEPPPPFSPPGCGSAGCADGRPLSPVCPVGSVPVSLEYNAPKGLPPDQGPGAKDEVVLAGPYYYAAARSVPNLEVREGAGVGMVVYSPTIPLALTHSLAELAVQGGPQSDNIVEIGWTVDRIVNGGSVDPHLFVYRWVNSVGGTYNGSGWVQFNNAIVPGMKLPVNSSGYAGYVIWQGNWWGWWNNQWVGYFPGSIWGPGVFTETNFHQWFGEVYRLADPPQTQMGNGVMGSNGRAAPARFDFVCEVDATPWLCFINAGTSLLMPTPAYYDAAHGGNRIYYGGPG